MFLFVCSLSTISAANQTINDTSTGGIVQGIADTDTGETLFLQPGTYNKTNQDTNISITKNITLQGNASTDKVIIDAKNLSRILTISSNLNVTFINITFTNANYSAGNGGAIYNNFASNMMTFINCTFTNNFVSSQGGAIYNNGANITIISSNFIANNASNQGGGIRSINDGIVTVISSNFIANNAGGAGGAISTNLIDTLIVNDSNFTNNTASAGGGISTGSNKTKMFISNSTFTCNSATTSGGGAVVASNMNVSNCTFINNNAYNNMGGAIYNDYNGTYMYIYDCNFTNNTANTSAGAIRSMANGIISNSIFIDNSAGMNGGAIRITHVDDMLVSNCFFINNSANNRGGAVENDQLGNVTVYSRVFINNTAAYGGAICNQNASMYISGNSMSDNVANLGQMIYNNGTMGILNLTYLSNSTVRVLNNTIVTLYATLADDMGNPVTGQNISFYVDGVLIGTVESIEGKANITYIANRLGISLVTGEYDGHGLYNININPGQLEIVKRDIIVIITVEENDDGSITIIANASYEDDGSPAKDYPVDFFLNGENVGSGITDENGIAKLTIPASKLNDGKNIISVIVNGNEQSNSETAFAEFIKTTEDPEDNPINNDTNDNNNSIINNNSNNNNSAVKAAMKNTGIPMIAIMLLLLTIFGCSIRKKE